MDAGASACRARRMARWQRIGLGVRLAYDPRRPELVRLWIGIGMKLADDGGAHELAVLQRLLALLMQVALDEALPWYWRNVCLELSARPQARLVWLLKRHDPLQAEAMAAVVDLARARLDDVPAAARGALAGLP